jgi:hypothetical protein
VDAVAHEEVVAPAPGEAPRITPPL